MNLKKMFATVTVAALLTSGLALDTANAAQQTFRSPVKPSPDRVPGRFSPSQQPRRPGPVTSLPVRSAYPWSQLPAPGLAVPPSNQVGYGGGFQGDQPDPKVKPQITDGGVGGYQGPGTKKLRPVEDPKHPKWLARTYTVKSARYEWDYTLNEDGTCTRVLKKIGGIQNRQPDVENGKWSYVARTPMRGRGISHPVLDMTFEPFGAEDPFQRNLWAFMGAGRDANGGQFMTWETNNAGTITVQEVK